MVDIGKLKRKFVCVYPSRRNHCQQIKINTNTPECSYNWLSSSIVILIFENVF